MSSNEHVGSLAENLIEALKENPTVAQKIEQARRQTKSEKKRLAMAMREKQLGALGMKTNEKGQVCLNLHFLRVFFYSTPFLRMFSMLKQLAELGSLATRQGSGRNHFLPDPIFVIKNLGFQVR